MTRACTQEEVLSLASRQWTEMRYFKNKIYPEAAGDNYPVGQDYWENVRMALQRLTADGRLEHTPATYWHGCQTSRETWRLPDEPSRTPG